MSERKVGDIIEVDVDSIIIPDGRYRKDFGDLESLAESIKAVGLKVPILINEGNVLIAGERRLRAHKLAELKTIRAIRESHSEVQHRIVEILENLERKAFTWQEEVKATEDVHNMMAAEGGRSWSLRKTAEKSGLSVGKLSTDLNLSKALAEDPEMFDKCTSKQTALKVLQKFKLDEAMAELALRKSATDYGKLAKNYVFNGNCLDLIEKLPDRSIDAIISDPVYGIEITHTKKSVRGVNEIYKDDREEYYEIMRELIKKANRVLKADAHVVMFCYISHYEFLRDEWAKYGFRMDPFPAIWYRPSSNGQCSQPAHFYGRTYEVFVYGTRGDATIVRQGQPNVFAVKGVSTFDKVHEVEKPIELMERIIERHCLPGQKILDPMCGSGTTILAALKHACLPIGFELDEINYKTAIVRIADALKIKDGGMQ